MRFLDFLDRKLFSDEGDWRLLVIVYVVLFFATAVLIGQIVRASI